MFVMAQEAKNFGWLKLYSVYFFAALAAMPQLLPLISPELQASLPMWFKSLMSITAVVGLLSRLVKQNGLMPVMSSSTE